MAPKKTKWNARSHITDLIIGLLEQGVGPWVCPWTRHNRGYDRAANVLDGSLPFNPCTGSGRSYNGLNPWLLAGASIVNGWTDPRFCTYKQLTKKKWKIKEDQPRKAGGPGPSDVYFWHIVNEERDPKTGEITRGKFFTVKMYRVWNYQQLEGPEPWAVPEAPEPLKPLGPVEDGVDWEEAAARDLYALAFKVCEAWDSEVPCSHGGDRAFYVPSADRIQMPTLDQFKSKAKANDTTVVEGIRYYLATRFHEMVHSTGHPSREKRDFSGRFGNEAYAFEELIAEIGAAILMAAAGVVSTGEVREDHASYIQSWIKVLKGDKQAIFTADSQAKKGVKRILDHAEKAGALPKPTKGGSTKPKGKARKKRSKAKAKAA